MGNKLNALNAEVSLHHVPSIFKFGEEVLTIIILTNN